MKLLRTINRLKDPRDLWLFLQILALLVALPGKIRRQPLPELLAGLDPGVAPVPRNEAKMKKTVGFIDSLLRYGAFQRYGHCLLRSLVLFRFLRRQGWPVEIHFGVRRTEEGESTPGTTAPASALRAASAAPSPSLAASAASPLSALDITGHSWLVLDEKIFLERESNDYFTTYSYPRRQR